MERAQSIKGLPLDELSITAIASIVDVYEDDETGRQLPVVEMEVINDADWQRFNAPKEEARRCALCGHGLKIACAVTHRPSGNGYWIGRDCAKSITCLAGYGKLIEGATVALAQRLACDKREGDWLAKNPDAMGIVTWAKRPAAPRICRDMVEKLRRFGSLSDKQVAVLEKIRQDDIDRRAKATAKVQPGRQTFKGIVRKVRVEEGIQRSRWGHAPKIAKVLLDLGTGVRLWGNLPENSTLTEAMMTRLPESRRACTKVGYEIETHEIVAVGDTIQMTATVEAKEGDDLFGFWKRPAKVVITFAAAPVAEPQAPSELDKAAAVLAANPVLAAPNFAKDVQSWNALKDEADRRGLTGDEATGFIAAGMKAVGAA